MTDRRAFKRYKIRHFPQLGRGGGLRSSSTLVIMNIYTPACICALCPNWTRSHGYLM